MANTASSLNLISLDYNEIQAAIRQYLSSTSEFQSYDFSTGGLAAIIKILAYNTWQNGFFTNMAISESFLDTAQMQQSVFSHAKELNYVPSSTTSASAQIKMSWQGNAAFYTIQKGQQFAALVRDLGSLIFTVPEDVIVISSNSSFSTNLTVYEGPYVADAYMMDYENPDQRFYLTNPNVDTSSITVAVTENSSIGANVFTRATTLLSLNGTNKVWFLQAAETGLYEILFGDGVVGYRPSDGAKLVFDYRVSVGSEGNGARAFSPSFSPIPSGASNLVVNTITAAQGGANVQSVDSVRFYAPRFFQIQERAVSADDYRILLMQQFPEIIDSIAYGGEVLNPPQYGKVFVSVVLNGVDGLPQDRQIAYTSFLETKCGLTTLPVIIEPRFQFLAVNSTITYDFSTTTLTPQNIAAAATQAIQNFANSTIGTFNSTFRYSRLLEAIDTADPSILSNRTTIATYLDLEVIKGGAPANFTANYGYALTMNPADDFNVYSANFIINGQTFFVADDGNGNMVQYHTLGNKKIPGAAVGSVDYANGTVTLVNFFVTDFNGPSLWLFVNPAIVDITSPQNTIIQLGNEVNVNVIATTVT